MSTLFDPDKEVTVLESLRGRIQRLRQDLETLRDAEKANADTSGMGRPKGAEDPDRQSKSYKHNE